MTLDNNIFRQLFDLLNNQTKLYEDYLKVQEDEKEALKKASVAKVKECTILRSNILERIVIVRSKVGEILSRENESKLLRLLSKKGSLEQKRILAPKIKNLRELIKKTQGKAKEYSQLLDFSSNLINGSLSILWSATQGIFKSYGRDRTIHQSYHPSNTGVGKDKTF